MKYLYVLSLSILLGSCGHLNQGPPGEPCSVSKTGTQTSINCSGSITVITDGSNGSTGIPGLNGHSTAFKLVSADSSMCVTGGSVISIGLDINDNHILESSEIGSVAVVCNGAVGPQGVQGTTGATGSIGIQGVRGIAGVDATPVTPVQFCTQYTSSTYPEYGFIIQGKLYATYSNGQYAWTSYVPPGTYVSSSVPSPCQFTVNAQGQVTWSQTN